MEITFTNTADFDIDPPVPASHLIPEWYKKMESYIGGEKKPALVPKTTLSTIKRCMPVFDAITAGYIITTPTDVYVHQDQEGKQYFRWPAIEVIDFHMVLQLSEHPVKNGNNDYPKWVSPWAIQVPKGYSVLFTQPMHHPNEYFTIFPGLVDCDTYHTPVNFPFAMKDPTWEGIIPKGTPIVQVIPFKRDKWKMKLGGEKEKLASLHTYEKIHSRFWDVYKDLFRTPKEFK